MIDATQTFIPLAGLVLATMLVTVLTDAREPRRTDKPTPVLVSQEVLVQLSQEDVDCVGRANCLAEAQKAYTLAGHLTEHSQADITNPYFAYKHFERVQLLLEHAAISPVPDEMADVEARQDAIKVDLNRTFQRSRVNFLNASKRKMYRGMARELEIVKAHFPERRAFYHQWALEQERDMKDRSIYPAPARL